MTSENFKSEDSEFEPDNSFFDSFLDGMDILMDNGENSETGNYHIARKANCTYSAEGGIPLIDLPGSSKHGPRDFQCLSRRDEITAHLTNSVLAHLEKTLRHRRLSKYRHQYNSCSTSQIVVDVLNRLKASVQQKEAPNSSSKRSHPEPRHEGHDVKQKHSNDVSQRSQNKEGSCLPHLSENSDTEISAVDGNKTATKLVMNQWICNEEARSHLKHKPNKEHSSGPNEGNEEERLQEKGKRERHKKRKTSKKAGKRSHSKSRKRHRSRNRSGTKKRVKTERAEDISKACKNSLNTDVSLESVSSADDDILNRVSSDEEDIKDSRQRATASQGYPRGFGEFDREEGEVLSSSSSDCETRRSSRNSHRMTSERYFRSEHCSPSPEMSRRCRIRRPRSPPWPPRYFKRLCADEAEKLIYRPRSPPENYLRLSPRRECLPEDVGALNVIQSSPREGRSASVPQLNRREDSVPPNFLRRRPRSPTTDQLGHEAQAFIGDGDRADSKIPWHHRGYRLHCQPRRLSPPITEAVPKSNQLFKAHLQTEMMGEVLPLSAFTKGNDTDPFDDNEKRSKSPILHRCLQEVRHLSRKPGHFVCDPDATVKTGTLRRVGPYASPVTLDQSYSPFLVFTTPRTRSVGTSIHIHTKSVECQTDDVKHEQVNVDKGQQPHSSGVRPLGSLLGLGKTVSFEYCRASSTPFKTIRGTCAETEAEDLGRPFGKPSFEEPAGSNSRKVVACSKFGLDSSSVDSSLSGTTVEMWKSIVSCRYPDWSERREKPSNTHKTNRSEFDPKSTGLVSGLLSIAKSVAPACRRTDGAQ